ncbi:unnamed protein product, partial [Discosporangium mesarthrocarpum]
VCVGTGCQLVSMTVIWLVFAVLGALSPSRRGSINVSYILLFVCTGSIAGYFSSRHGWMYKMFRGSQWRRNTIMTAILFPGVVFSVFLIINYALSVQGSSGAVHFWTLLSLMILWLMISAPLVFVGSYIGYKQEVV